MSHNFPSSHGRQTIPWEGDSPNHKAGERHHGFSKRLCVYVQWGLSSGPGTLFSPELAKLRLSGLI